jgi:hypothetical protein
VGASRVVDASLEEMAFVASSTTLADAGLTAADVGGVVIYGQDQMNGRVISCVVAAGPVGGVDRDVTMIASSREHAMISVSWLARATVFSWSPGASQARVCIPSTPSSWRRSSRCRKPERD